jgi:hypothetical protein
MRIKKLETIAYDLSYAIGNELKIKAKEELEFVAVKSLHVTHCGAGLLGSAGVFEIPIHSTIKILNRTKETIHPLLSKIEIEVQSPSTL